MRRKPIDVLREMRKYLKNKNHWVKGAEKEGCKVCLLGAVFTFTKIGSSLQEKTTDILAKEIYRRSDRVLSPESIHSIVTDYNDAPHRRHKDILGLLDRVIRKQEQIA